MVRDTKTPDERIESTRGIGMSPEELRSRRRLFVNGNTTNTDPGATHNIAARADADFERIFGTE